MTAPQDWTLNPEALGRFLTVLDPDVIEAGRKYERLRRKLIRLFEWRGCRFAEDLADESINRVIRRMDGGLVLGPGEVPRFSAGVAHRVFLEHLREVKRAQPSPGDVGKAPWVPGRHETTDLRLVCLERCLERLPPPERDLVLRYYAADPTARIENRRVLARELGIEVNNLRIRVFRLRSKLERWMGDDIESSKHGSSKHGGDET